jgi:DNA (cytosine-5)-methyltransferase 1
MSKQKILNLYAGIGGNRKLWTDCEVTAVENVQHIADVYKQLYPDDIVIVVDAHQYLLEHFKEFDFIWSSPPCPTHSRMNTARAGTGMAYRYPDMKLYEEIIFLQNFYKGNWVVENVIGYYEPLLRPVAELDRHYFWSNRHIGKTRSERTFAGNLTHATTDILSNSHGITLPLGTKDSRKLLRNAVDPLLGLHVLQAVGPRIIGEVRANIELFSELAKPVEGSNK